MEDTVVVGCMGMIQQVWGGSDWLLGVTSRGQFPVFRDKLRTGSGG